MPKRTAATPPEGKLDGLRSTKGVILSLEGTVVPKSYFEETLYPYVRDHLKEFLQEHYEMCQTTITLLRQLAQRHKASGLLGVTRIPENADKETTIKAVVANVHWQMSRGRKSAELANLLEKIGTQAYEQRKLQGELYPDVIPTLRQVVRVGIQVFVLSSESSFQSQHSLFSYTTEGDVVDIFTNLLYRTAGSKQVSTTYQKIADDLVMEPKDILFVTDNPREANAAVKSGMECKLVIRAGNPEISANYKLKYCCIETLDELLEFRTSENEGKKRKTFMEVDD